jgi:BlaI family penicillinase repressor
MADLNRNELEALRILWERGSLKPSDIQAEFAWAIENATLRSVLRGLVEAGHAVREKRGKAFHYRATTSRRSLMSSMARRMAHVFSGGSTAGLIAQLMRSQRLSPEDIAELQRIAAERAPEGFGGTGSRP